MSSPSLDFSFDKRVAGQYDAQRALPADVSRQVGTAIADITGQHARILELGVGTGRIALPVAAAGCDVVGIDISADMLQQLLETEPVRQQRLRLVNGDISRLPFRTEAFDAVTAVHVLHLVDEWQRIIDDSVAVLRPRSHFIMGRDWIDPESMSGQLQNELRRAVIGLAKDQLKAPASWNDFSGRLEECGFVGLHTGTEDLIAAEWEVQVSPADFIAAVRRRTNPESWILTDDLMAPVVARLEAAVAEHWPGPDEPRTVRRRFLLSVFGRQ